MKNNEQLKRIQEAAEAKFIDSSDACVRNALKRWREEQVEVDEEPLGELTHTISSADMEKLAVEWNVAEIEANIAVERAKLAMLRTKERYAQFVSKLAELEGVYATSDETNVVISRMEVWEADTEAIRRDLPRTVVNFTRAVASGSVSQENLADGRIPREFKNLRLIDDYVRDIADFLSRAGEEGKALLKEICDDMESASSVAQQGCPDTMPEHVRKPLQFLAQQVVETHTTQASLKHKAFGFSVS